MEDSQMLCNGYFGITRGKTMASDFYRMNNGTILRVIKINLDKNLRLIAKVRCIRPCAGVSSSKKRIGKAYTYQGNMAMCNIRKKGKPIGTDELLGLLFYKTK